MLFCVYVHGLSTVYCTSYILGRRYSVRTLNGFNFFFWIHLQIHLASNSKVLWLVWHHKSIIYNCVLYDVSCVRRRHWLGWKFLFMFYFYFRKKNFQFSPTPDNFNSSFFFSLSLFLILLFSHTVSIRYPLVCILTLCLLPVSIFYFSFTFCMNKKQKTDMKATKKNGFFFVLFSATHTTFFLTYIIFLYVIEAFIF